MVTCRGPVCKTGQQGKPVAGRDGERGQKANYFGSPFGASQAGRGTITSTMTPALMGGCEEGVGVCVCWAGVAGASGSQNRRLALLRVYFPHPVCRTGAGIQDRWPLLGGRGFRAPPDSCCAPPGSCVEMQAPWTPPAESESLGVGPGHVSFYKFSRPFLRKVR